MGLCSSKLNEKGVSNEIYTNTNNYQLLNTQELEIKKFNQVNKRVSSNTFYDNIDLAFSLEPITKVYVITDQILGKGAYGQVQIGYLKKFPQKKYAIKIIQKTKDTVVFFERELQILRKLDHPNLVRFCEIYVTQDKFYIVQELCEGDSLKNYQQQVYKLQENEVREIFYQICLGLSFMHSNNICHRDLKLENILFKGRSKNLVKIIDFGLSKENIDEKMKSYIGTPYYVAPEVLEQKGYDKQCDMWSLGVCLYRMLTGEYPYTEQHTYRLIKSIQNDPINLKPYNLSDEAQDLIKGLLTKNPKKRLTLDQTIIHPFFSLIHKKKRISISKIFIQQMIQQFLDYKEISRLKLFLVKIMVTFYHDIETFQNEMNLYNQIDIGKHGLISEEEMIHYAKITENEIFLQKIPQLFQKDFFFYENCLTITDFIAIVMPQTFWFQNEEEKQFLYQLFDNENQGYFDLFDFKERFIRMAIQLPESELKTLFGQFQTSDPNQNKVTQDEFYQYLANNFKQLNQQRSFGFLFSLSKMQVRIKITNNPINKRDQQRSETVFLCVCKESLLYSLKEVKSISLKFFLEIIFRFLLITSANLLYSQQEEFSSMIIFFCFSTYLWS